MSSPKAGDVDDFNELRAVAMTPRGGWAVGHRLLINRTSIHGSETLILAWDGRRWEVVSSPNPTGWHNELNEVSASGDDDAWALGQGTGRGDRRSRSIMLHWDGHNWSSVPIPPEVGRLTDVLAIDRTEAWLAGSGGANDGRIARWNGERWRVEQRADFAISSLTLDSRGRLWAFGSTQRRAWALRRDAGRWTRLRAPGRALVAVAASTRGELLGIANTASGLRRIARWTGTRWRVASIPGLAPLVRLNDIAVDPSGRGWVVGDGGLVARYTC